MSRTKISDLPDVPNTLTGMELLVIDQFDVNWRTYKVPLSAVILAATGPVGPAGPAGPAGPTGPAGPLAIGTAVTGSTAKQPLSTDAAGNLSQATAYVVTTAGTWTSTVSGTTFSYVNTGSSASFCRVVGGILVYAGQFVGGGFTVQFCTALYAVNATVGKVRVAGTAGNCFASAAAAAAPAPNVVAVLPLSVFGAPAPTDLLGTPLAWELREVGGVVYKSPLY